MLIFNDPTFNSASSLTWAVSFAEAFTGYAEAWAPDMPFDGEVASAGIPAGGTFIDTYINGVLTALPAAFTAHDDIRFVTDATGSADIVFTVTGTAYDDPDLILGDWIWAEFGTFNNCTQQNARAGEGRNPVTVISDAVTGAWNRSAFTSRTATVGDGDFTIEWEQGCLPYVLGIGFNAGTFAGNWDTNTDFTLAIPSYNGNLYVWENGAGPYSNARNSWASGIYFTGGTGTRWRVKVDTAGTVTYEAAPPNSAYQVIYTSATTISASTVLYGVVGIYAPSDKVHGIKLTGPWQ